MPMLAFIENMGIFEWFVVTLVIILVLYHVYGDEVFGAVDRWLKQFGQK